MTKRKTEAVERGPLDDERVIEAEADLEPTINPPVGEATPWIVGHGKDEPNSVAYADAVQAARERFALLREVLTHTHATARLPADLLRRIQEAVS